MKNKKLMGGVQCLRGICALIVFFSHALCVYQNDVISYLHHSPWHLFFDGQIAVMIFFVLSGYFSHSLDLHNSIDVLVGILRKYVRLIFPYIISISVGILFCNYFISQDFNQPVGFTKWFAEFWQSPKTLTDFLREVEIFFRPESKFLINPASWYLTPELKAMIVLPIVGLFLKSKYLYPLFVLSLAILYKSPLLFYSLGMLLHVLQKKHVMPMVNSKINVILIMFVALLLLNVKNFGFDNFFYKYIQIVGAICIIYIFTSYDKICYWCNSLLEYFGHISYEFYIIHFVILLILSRYITNPLLYILVSFLLSILTAEILNRLNSLIIATLFSQKQS